MEVRPLCHDGTLGGTVTGTGRSVALNPLVEVEGGMTADSEADLGVDINANL